MGKAAFTAPLYISIAWSLIISYQLFTQTAVYSIVHFLTGVWPSADSFAILRLDTIVFIHAFAWIFVLSSVIPSIILGKGRSVLLQFFLCLTVAFVAVSIEDIIRYAVGSNPTTQVQTFSGWFQNPIIAGVYLSVPYILMLYIDIRSRRNAGKVEPVEEVEREPLIKEAESTGQKTSDAVAIYEVDKKDKICQNKRGEKMHFLFGASAVCFFLGTITFLLGDMISTTILDPSYRFVFVIIFLILGLILLSLGFYSTKMEEQLFSRQIGNSCSHLFKETFAYYLTVKIWKLTS